MSYYALGLCIMADQKETIGFKIGIGLFAVIPCFFVQYYRLKLAVGFALIFLGSIFFYF